MKRLQFVWWGWGDDTSLPRWGWIPAAPAFAFMFRGSFFLGPLELRFWKEDRPSQSSGGSGHGS